MVQNGWPKRRCECPSATKSYWNYRDEISIQDDIIFRGERVIIPRKIQHEMLQIIHGAHLGVEKCKRRARDVLFWPGMSSQIEDVVSSCQICAQFRQSNQKEPLLPHEIPQRPWAKVGSDLFEIRGQTFLIMVDYYSGFFEIDNLKQSTSKDVITCCKAQFARYGIPDVLITDNGPQFASVEFQTFASDYQFKHKTSSPRYPRSNGMSEKSVQTAKRLLIKAKEDNRDSYLALLDYRNTPRSDLFGSPVQRLMGRRTKTLLPTSNLLLEPKVIKTKVVISEMQKAKNQQKRYYDVHAKQLPALRPGQSIRVQMGKQWKLAVVTSSHKEPRSYNITTQDGQTYRRNRHHLRPEKPTTTCSLMHDDDWPNDELSTSDRQPATEINGELNRGSETIGASVEPTISVRRSTRNVQKPIQYDNSWM